MKNILILAIAAATLTAGALLALADAASVEPPGEAITVTNYGTKDAVTFDHSLHTGEGTECVACHHTATAEAADTAQYKCGECHKVEAENDTPKIKDALHGKDKGVCYSCHLEKEAANKLKCASCHKG